MEEKTTKEKRMREMTFTEQLIQEGDTIVAYCPELDLSSCGDTVEESRENLRVAIRLFLEEAARMGTLTEILTEAGYDVTRETLTSPVIEIAQQTLSLEQLPV